MYNHAPHRHRKVRSRTYGESWGGDCGKSLTQIISCQEHLLWGPHENTHMIPMRQVSFGHLPNWEGVELTSQREPSRTNEGRDGASLVQWLRIHLPVQETWVRLLVREDPACWGAAKPMSHNHWVRALEPVFRKKRSHRSEKPVYFN